MAATKSTKTTKSKKPSGKTKTTTRKTGAKKTKKTTKSKKSSTTKKTKTTASKKTKGTVNVFLANVVKQANKVQKKAQAETKVWIKKLNTQDKQLSQLTKKITKAKGRSKRSLDTKITKLQGQMSVTRSGLLMAENATDKVATLIEWTTQLSAKPTSTAFMQTSRPTVISGGKSRTQTTHASPYAEEEYPEESDQEMNFLFGEDEDEEANR